MVLLHQPTNRRCGHGHYLFPPQTERSDSKGVDNPATAGQARPPWRTIPIALHRMLAPRLAVGWQHVPMEQRPHHCTIRPLRRVAHCVCCGPGLEAGNSNNTKADHLESEHHWRHVVRLLLGLGDDDTRIVSDEEEIYI